jgi:hypothetical protein
LKTILSYESLNLTTKREGGDALHGTKIFSTHKPYSLTMAASEMRVLANRDLAGETQGSAFFSQDNNKQQPRKRKGKRK